MRLINILVFIFILFTLNNLSVEQIFNCSNICVDPCGCYNNCYPFNNTPAPDHPNDLGLQWRLFTRQNRNIFNRMDINDVPSEYDGSKRTMWLIHGWQEEGPVWDSTKNAIIDAIDVNVVVVHWERGSGHVDYFQSAANTRMVGGCTAAMMRHLIDYQSSNADRNYCVGLSLGGQVCGFMGKKTQELGGMVMARISALDPAGPAFEKPEVEARLDKSDATLVDTVHTDGHELGLGFDVSHVDFYPNNGTSPQPPCLGGICSHLVSRDYYRGSIDTNHACQFTSYPCSSAEAAAAGQCETCTSGVDCQRMGYYADTMPGRGTFFLRTTAGYPHCMGNQK